MAQFEGFVMSLVLLLGGYMLDGSFSCNVPKRLLPAS